MTKIHKIHYSENATKNVIFVHGLSGSPFKTWGSTEDEIVGVFKWLQEENIDTNIWTVEYDARVFRKINKGMGIIDRANNILQLFLENNNFSKGEIVFIGHSLGGLIIKQMLRRAEDLRTKSSRDFLLKVTKVGFIGTPHLGSKYATFLKKISNKFEIIKYLACKICASQLTEDLALNNELLRELNNWYDIFSKSKNITTRALCETQKTYDVITIVEIDSAAPSNMENAAPVDANHINICKPSSKEDYIYVQILNFINYPTLSWQDFFLQSHFRAHNSGWAGYTNWSNDCQGEHGEYIYGDDANITSSANPQEKINAIEGINTIRKKLHNGENIRLVGLSGVGKTRLLQALFDERIGDVPLEKDNVFYADVADEPSPAPQALLAKLIDAQKKSYLIIDNCSPSAHFNLVSKKDTAQHVGIITVEYDVKDDTPSESTFFLLEPCSEDVIEKVLLKNYPHISSNAAKKITVLSGNNFRIAKLLVENIGKSENIPELSDNELYKRLFFQNTQYDNQLEKSAMVFSLLYSFQLEFKDDYSGNNDYTSDILLLSKISSISESNLYSYASELQNRQIIQKRSVWRAILPHALANRLAKQILEQLPIQSISRHINIDTEYRVLKSFANRLGYLNNSERAKNIVHLWLSDGNLIDKLSSVDIGLSLNLLEHVVHISQDEIMYYIKTKINVNSFDLENEHDNLNIFFRIVRFLAYEPNLFTQSINILLDFCNIEKTKKQSIEYIEKFFQPVLSGTKANLQCKLELLKKIAIEDRYADLTLSILKTALRDSWYGLPYENTKNLNREYDTLTYPELCEWYKHFLEFAKGSFLQTKDKGIKKAIGNKFRHLYKHSELRELLVKICIEISEQEFWAEGYVSINELLRYDKGKIDANAVQELEKLKQVLKYNNLSSKIEYFLFTPHNSFHEYDELDDDGEVKEYGQLNLSQRIEQLAQEAVADVSYFKSNMLKFILHNSPCSFSRLHQFARFYALHSETRISTWYELIALAETREEKLVSNFFAGFMQGIQEKQYDESQKLLDCLLNNKKLNYIFVLVQLDCKLDGSSFRRLVHFIKQNDTDMYTFRCLGHGKKHLSFSDHNMIILLKNLLKKENSYAVVVDILSMRFHSFEEYTPSKEIIQFTWYILSDFDYNKNKKYSINSRISYGLNILLKTACAYDLWNKEHKKLFLKLKEYLLSLYIYDIEYNDIIGTLFKNYSFAFLESLLEDNGLISTRINNTFRKMILDDKKFTEKIAVEEILVWCNNFPNTRYEVISYTFLPYQKVNGIYEWTELAKIILENAPNPIAVLDAYEGTFSTTSRTNNSDTSSESYRTLIEELKKHENSIISNHANKMSDNLEQNIEFWKKTENREEITFES